MVTKRGENKKVVISQILPSLLLIFENSLQEMLEIRSKDTYMP